VKNIVIRDAVATYGMRSKARCKEVRIILQYLATHPIKKKERKWVTVSSLKHLNVSIRREKSFKSLLIAFKTVGYDKRHPMQIDVHPDGMRVRDGCHRLCAARKTKLPKVFVEFTYF